MASDEDDDSFMSSDMENSKADKPVDNMLQQDIMALEPKLSNMLNLKSQAHNLQRQLDHERSSRISAENKKKSLENDNALLTQKIAALSKEKTQLEHSKIDLESKFQTLQLSHTEESERKKNADMVITRLREQLAKSTEQGKLEMESKQKYEMEIITIKTKLQNLQKHLDQEKKEKDELLVLLNNAKTAWLIQSQSPDGSSHNNSVAQSDGSQSKDAVASSVQKKNDSVMDDTKKKLNDLESENKKLRTAATEAEALRKELSDKKNELAKVNSELEETDRKKKELQRKLDSGDDNATTLLDEKEREISKLKNSNQTLQDKLKEKDEKCLQLETELAVANVSLAENKNKISDLVNKADDLQKKQDQLEEDCRKEKVENVRLQSKLEALEERCNDMKEERDNCKQQLVTVEQKLREVDQKTLLATTQKSEQNDAVEKLKDKLKECTDERRHLVNKLEEQEADKSQLARELREKEEEIKQLKQQQQNEKLADDTKEKIAENERLKRGMDELKKELNDAKAELRVSESKSGDMKEELEKLEQDLRLCKRELRDKNEELRSAFDNMNSDQAKLKNSDLDQKKKQELGYQCSDERLMDVSSNEDNGNVSPSQMGRKSSKKHRSGRRNDQFRNENQSEVDSISSQIALLKAQLRAAKKHLKSSSDGGLDSENESELSILSPEEREKLKRHAKNLMSELQHLQRAERVNHMNGNLSSSAMDDNLLAEIEAKIRVDLNSKLSSINEYLQQHSDVCERIDRLRDEAMEREREAASQLLQKNADRTDESLTLADLYATRNQQHDPTSLSNGMTCLDGATLNITDSILSSNLLKELHRSISKHLEKCPQLELARADDPMSIAARRSSYDQLSSLKRQHLLS